MKILAGVLVAAALMLATATWMSVRDPVAAYERFAGEPRTAQVLDRVGNPLSRRYLDAWNFDDQIAVHELPDLLMQCFVKAEDQRFFEHGGVDWAARVGAIVDNLRAGKVVRGASTITEQMVRMLMPRPRTFWSRWLEGWEAHLLERRLSKQDILSFYLNQVPYASNRRGVAQAARFYFDRTPETLDRLQMQTLAVLVRAPSLLDPREGRAEALRLRVNNLRERMGDDPVPSLTLDLAAASAPVDAAHFVRAVRARYQRGDTFRTTLDASLQSHLQALLSERLAQLSGYDVDDAALLVADHRTGEVLAWVVASRNDTRIDAVRTPRQPGSTLKPFAYGLALDRGWNADTLIDDKPLRTPVGHGLHRFDNYSHDHHGRVPLRQALGASLNIPAVHAVRYIGVDRFLFALRDLGLNTLVETPQHYGEGLVLGNGEVTLEALVTAYAALAGGGRYRPLRSLRDEPSGAVTQVLSGEAASLVGNILSDAQARELEFGSSSVLSMPRQTAVKTGTSTDHRDAWTVGYDSRYVAGVWMGNLDRRRTRGLSGARGPALVLRGVFARLNRGRASQRLWLSPKLALIDGEYYLPGRSPVSEGRLPELPLPRLAQPTDGLKVAIDPRLPDEAQAMSFVVDHVRQADRVQWRLNNKLLSGQDARLSWPLVRGTHSLQAVIVHPDGARSALAPVVFEVR